MPPGTIECSSATTAFTAAADARFEANGATSARRGPLNAKAEAHISERGGKVMEGTMLMYGAHRRYANSATEKVEGCAHEWPDRYNPNGSDAPVVERVHEHAQALAALEKAVLPEAAATRLALSNQLDPPAMYRLREFDLESPLGSISLSSGFVVQSHDDSGLLETVVFTWPAEEPMPDGHEWLFVVANCLHPLPQTRDQMALCAVRGKGVRHGTLPTSSTQPHLTNHAGVGSALVTKSQLVNLLQKQQAGGPPPPTPKQLEDARAAGRNKDERCALELNRRQKDTVEAQAKEREAIEALRAQDPERASEHDRASVQIALDEVAREEERERLAKPLAPLTPVRAYSNSFHQRHSS